jgi:hypothetical protein
VPLYVAELGCMDKDNEINDQFIYHSPPKKKKPTYGTVSLNIV